MPDTQQGKSVYLAARYSRYPEMQQVRSLLDALGYTVTSRWINGGHELTKEGSTEAHEAERIRYAQEDMADLLAADIVISFTEEPRTTKTRGGRHVEFGAALALRKTVIVIGYRENVFHTLPEVLFYPTLADCMAAAPWREPNPLESSALGAIMARVEDYADARVDEYSDRQPPAAPPHEHLRANEAAVLETRGSVIATVVAALIQTKNETA